MRSGLHDPAALDHMDTVSIFNSTETVRYDKTGPTLHEFVQCVLDQSLAL